MEARIAVSERQGYGLVDIPTAVTEEDCPRVGEGLKRPAAVIDAMPRGAHPSKRERPVHVLYEAVVVDDGARVGAPEHLLGSVAAAEHVDCERRGVNLTKRGYGLLKALDLDDREQGPEDLFGEER